MYRRNVPRSFFFVFPFFGLVAVLFAFLFVILLTTHPIQAASPALAAHEGQTESWAQGYADGQFVPGQILVGVQSGLSFNKESDAALTDLMAQAGASVLRADLLPAMPAQAWAEASQLAPAALDLASTVRIQIWRVPVGREVAALTALRSHPQVLYAEPDGVVRAAELPTPVTPTDPLYAASQWSMQRINVSRAWIHTTGALATGAGLRVAVVDSGIDLGHPEFAGRIVFSKNYVVPSRPAQDDNGHGTHVAGIIAAAQNNGVGISGVAPTVLLDIRRVLSNGPQGLTGSVSNLTDAIFEAADAGAKVINLSVETSVADTTLQTVITLATNKGALLIGSAGNLDSSGTTYVYYPAAYDSVMAVAATDRYDRHAYYSRVGPQIEIAAPGGLVQASSNPPINDPIISTWATATFCGTSYQSTSSYCTSVGTSMAAPFVSGTAALIRSLRPDLSPAQVRAILTETATPLPNQDANKIGKGRVDAAAAVRRAILSDVVAKPGTVGVFLPPGQTVTRTMTVGVTNPSSDPITWTVGATSASWLTVTGSTTGIARYGQDGSFGVVITSTNLATGTHTGQVNLTGIRSNGSQISRRVDVSVLINGAPRQVYLPLALGASPTIQRNGTWETPGATVPVTLTMFAGSSRGLQLPFTMTLRGKSYPYARLSANGLLFLQSDPAQPLGTDVGVNRCLSSINGTDWLDKGVAGWWANLDPSRGGTVRTFQPAGTPRFVVEFSNVASAAGINPAYTVSFQMVLYAYGNIGLNYRAVPTNPTGVTVGAVALDGLVYNQLACRTVSPASQVGDLPRSGTSYLITSGDLY